MANKTETMKNSLYQLSPRVLNDNHQRMKLHVKHLERASLMSRKRVVYILLEQGQDLLINFYLNCLSVVYIEEVKTK